MVRFRLIFLLLFVAPLTAQAITVEEWLESWVEIQPNNGEWQLVETSTLPQPPLHILTQQKDKILLQIDRQLTWIPRISVRLSEERPIIMNCQVSTQDHAEDYQNFGIRGKENNTIGFECADNNQLIQQQ